MGRTYPWIGTQTWRHIYFLNWPLCPNIVRRHIPEPLQLELYEGMAWLTVVVFFAENNRLRYLPNVDLLPTIKQVNVRTYVIDPRSKKKGVYFFSLYVGSRLATIGAKTLYSLPFMYVNNNVNFSWLTNDILHIERLNLKIYLNKTDDIVRNDLSHFLTERYYIWNVKGKKIIKIPVSHSKWNLYNTKAHIIKRPFPNLNMLENPIAYYTKEKQAFLSPFETTVFIG